MGSTIRLFGALFASTALLISGNGLFQTLISVYLAGVDAAPDIVAPILSGYYVGFVLGSLRGPVVVARVGHIRAFAVFTAFAAAAALAHPVFEVGWAWVVLRLVAGFAMAGVFVVIESWLNDRAPSARRGTIMSIYMIVNFAALAFGQYLLTLATPTTFILFNLAALLFTVAVVPVGAIRVEMPTPGPRPRLGLVALYRVSPLAIAGVAAVGLMNGAFYSLAPIYATRIGLEPHGVSVFMGSVIVGGLLLQWPVGRLSDRFDRRLVLIGLSVLAAATAAAFVISAQPAVRAVIPAEPWLFLTAALYGGCVFTLYPVLVAHAHDFATPDQRIATSAGLLLAFGVGAAFGPAVVTPPMSIFGPEALFMFTGATAALIALYAAHRMRQRAPMPTETKPAFQPLPPMLKGSLGLERQSAETQRVP